MGSGMDERLSQVCKQYSEILVDPAEGAYLWGDDRRRQRLLRILTPSFTATAGLRPSKLVSN